METPGRAIGTRRPFDNVLDDDDFVNETPPRQRRRINFPENVFEEPDDQTTVIRELREIKDLLKGMSAKQGEMENALAKVTRQMAEKNFDLAKSSHAANVTKILAKAYVQLGRFTKTNESKTYQLQQEFTNTPYGLPVNELMTMAATLERNKFTYWRAEERRRVLAIGSWSALRIASTREVSAKLCSLLGVRFNVALEKAVFQQTALVRSYISEQGVDACLQDDHFWINFTWKENKYGARGPSQMEWDVLLTAHE